MQETMNFDPEWAALLMGLLTSFLVSVLIVMSKCWHGAFTADSTEGIQKVHKTPTPRVGGIALLAGMLAVWWQLGSSTDKAVAEQSHALLALILLGGLPAFAAGLLEDITKRVSVRTRLLATASSGLVFCILTGYWVNTVSIPTMDYLLMVAPFGFAFTAFAVSGIANSVNIIDGFNGLASGVVVLMLCTLALIAFRVGDLVVLNLALGGAAVVLGFMLLNFPRGLLFLGDAGAYSLGYFVAVLAVSLVYRNPVEVSPWAMLLVCGYPVVETLFSIYRRLSRPRRRSPGTPDASHLHSLLYRRIISRRLAPNQPRWKKNACTSPFLWLYSAVPMLGAIFWPESLAMVVAWLFISVAIYLRFYRRVIHLNMALPPKQVSTV